MSGEVDNRTDGVSVIVRGDLKSVGLLSDDILENAPPASQIKSIEVNPRNVENYDSFRIVTSKNIDERITEISPDIAVCDECLNDLEKDREMIIKNINSPLSCGAGRFFDAVSALTGLCPVTTFDSEAPMRLESAINCDTDLYYPFSIDGTIVFADTFKEMLNDLPQNDVSFISAKFHNTMAQIILEVSKRIRKKKSLKKVVISGGVFQNKYLLEKSLELLINDNFDVYTNHLVPTNDGGVSLGQLIIASKRLGLCV